MNKQQAERLMNKAVKAYRQNALNYQSIMDDASVYLSDEQWEELDRRLNEADSMPALPPSPKAEQEQLEADVQRARLALDEAEKRLYAFYARKHSKKQGAE